MIQIPIVIEWHAKLIVEVALKIYCQGHLTYIWLTITVDSLVNRNIALPCLQMKNFNTKLSQSNNVPFVRTNYEYVIFNRKLQPGEE